VERCDCSQAALGGRWRAIAPLRDYFWLFLAGVTKQPACHKLKQMVNQTVKVFVLQSFWGRWGKM
jgi:hypothetical protein